MGESKKSLRVVPSASYASSFTHIASNSLSAPSAPVLHDTLRAGVGPSPLDNASAISAHPLEVRLKAWEATRESLRLETLRRAYGMAEPIRRGMELKVTRDGEWRPAALGGLTRGGLHEQILTGRDTTVDWEDVYTGEANAAHVSMHDEMERKLKM